jgi:hypothetical protein
MIGLAPIEACATADPNALLATRSGRGPFSPMPNDARQADKPSTSMIIADNFRMTFLAQVCKSHSDQRTVVFSNRENIAIVPIICALFTRDKQILLHDLPYFVADCMMYPVVVFHVI